MEHDALRLLVAALAAWRLAYLFTIDTGPARIFERIRAAVLAHFGPGSWQYEGATCAFCQSVWYAFAAVLALFWGRPLQDLICLWLAAAGLAALAHWWVLERMARARTAVQ